MIQLNTQQHIHFIGIGGFGLSAIARVLLEQGYSISGSDRNSNAFTRSLAQDGVRIHAGHQAEYVENADIVLASSAISANHVEILRARELNIPVVKRSDIIAEIMASHPVRISVAGTHGKTTTTSMITHTLLQTKREPTYIIGGVLPLTGQNGGYGNGQTFVIEADEYDNMFHGLQPTIAVVTNVEYDHPDFFKSPEEFFKSFETYIKKLPDNGVLVVCRDDKQAYQLAQARKQQNLPVVTYSTLENDADWYVENIRTEQGKTVCDVIHKRFLHDKVYLNMRLSVVGRHNIANALATLAVADLLEVDLSEAIVGLENFEGAGRRFDLRGSVDDIFVIDDYAHHPTEIKAVLEASKQRYPQHELWAVWQPHTYTRTQTFTQEYLQAFELADHVLITDIFPSREQPIAGVTSANLVQQMQHSNVHHTATFADAVTLLRNNVTSPAVILIMSAGDAPQIGIDYLHQMGHNSHVSS